MRALIFILVTAVLTACATSGTQIDPAKVASFQRGRTTVSEVQSALGAPNGTSLLPDGSRVMVYTYVHAHARPETFIPIIGGFVGGADAQAQSVSFFFGPDGVLRSGSSYQSQSRTGMGLSAR
jgi:outer membrane protein assembly factor BamE (lipoprotein component of BamABCDE complex)